MTDGVARGEWVCGWRSAAAVAERSVAGIQKLVRKRKLRVEYDGKRVRFLRADLIALGPAHSVAGAPAPAASTTPIVPAPPASVPPEVGPSHGAVLAASPAPAGHQVPVPPASEARPGTAPARRDGAADPLTLVRARLDAAEAHLNELRAEVAAVVEALRATNGDVQDLAEGAPRTATQLARVVRRLDDLARRVAEDGTQILVAGHERRLGQIESVLRCLPMAHAVLDGRKCGRCRRGQIVVAAGCPSCGLGLGPAPQ